MRYLAAATLLILTASAASARQQSPAPSLPSPAQASPAQVCAAAIGVTEQKLGIPKGLLQAIGLVESGRTDPAAGRVAPWPWIINVAGEDHVFATKADAVAATQALQAQGVRSIDVGCVQVNLMYHPNAFASLDEAFDPQANVAYGGRFLRQLYAGLGTWESAAGAYHSQTPTVGDPYRERVLARWNGSATGRMPTAAFSAKIGVYGIWPPPGAQYAAIPPANFAFRCCGTTSTTGH